MGLIAPLLIASITHAMWLVNKQKIEIFKSQDLANKILLLQKASDKWIACVIFRLLYHTTVDRKGICYYFNCTLLMYIDAFWKHDGRGISADAILLATHAVD